MTLPKRIMVLPSAVADMIAAGEVVERPASVVKELIENSLDAGAPNIEVSVAGAGGVLVAVSDDGDGMGPEDALQSLRRHATSKIRSAEDLERIGTLGFRGEALASIAAVSRLSIVTRVRGSDEAVRVLAEGGRVSEPECAAGAPGTTVEVRDLFFNTPARKKFLKSDATELKNISDAVLKTALAHPETGFKLSNEGRQVMNFPPGQTLRDRASQALNCRSPIYWHVSSEGERSLAFAFTSPSDVNGRRDALKLFVNRRPVNDRILFSAVMDGYRGRMPEGRYPLAVLWINLPPGEVDVNVHPAKREVRFAEEGSVFRWVAGNVGRALSASPWAVSGGEWPVDVPEMAGYGGNVPSGEPEGERRGRVAQAVRSYGERNSSATALPLPDFRGGRGYGRNEARLPSAPQYADGAWERPSVPEELHPVFGGLRYLGNFDATYLVFEDGRSRELVLLDQHAAHERLIYEKLLKGSRARNASQKLLVPVVVEFPHPVRDLFEERSRLFEEAGLRAELFGSTALSVMEAPPGLNSQAISEIADEILNSGDDPASKGADARGEDVMARAACRAAVKAGKALLPSEAEELVRLLSGLENPAVCPHGRPVLVRMGVYQIEKLFRRR